jgi:hypothetical protein
MNAGLQYRRMESITRSPIFTHFTEVRLYLSIIIASEAFELIVLKNMNRQSLESQRFGPSENPNCSCQRWLN